MAIESAWQPLTPAVLDALPDAMAVFELGSLVRSVLYIGGDPNEGLRAAVRRALADTRVHLRAHCLRWQSTSDPRGSAAQLLAQYRAAHGGASPVEQPRPVPGVRVFLPLAPDAPPAPQRAASASKRPASDRHVPARAHRGLIHPPPRRREDAADATRYSCPRDGQAVRRGRRRRTGAARRQTRVWKLGRLWRRPRRDGRIRRWQSGPCLRRRPSQAKIRRRVPARAPQGHGPPRASSATSVRVWSSVTR